MRQCIITTSSSSSILRTGFVYRLSNIRHHGTIAKFQGFVKSVTEEIPVDASNIQIITSPTNFYETLLKKIANAQRSIFLSTLYVGKTEHGLVKAIEQSIERHPQLQVAILVDALRGTREHPSGYCAIDLFVPLLRRFSSDRIRLHAYHTPNLQGALKLILPKRINEGWGLQHMKLYSFDNEIILSGANLSSDYFTNRQDRYIMFKSEQLVAWYRRLFDAVERLSYTISPKEPATFSLNWENKSTPEPSKSPKAFVEHAQKKLLPLLKVNRNEQKQTTDQTVVYPLAQLSSLIPSEQSTEHQVNCAMLDLLSDPTLDAKWVFTAGYFNPAPPYASRLLLSDPSNKGTLITAHPHANGFFGSAGISGALPAAYTLLASSFLQRCRASGVNVDLREWQNGVVGQPAGWTYHAKGKALLLVNVLTVKVSGSIRKRMA